MTVEELIAELENMDPEMEVKFSYNYGDHWRTQVAEEIRSVEEEHVCWSEYHRMDKVLNPDEDYLHRMDKVLDPEEDDIDDECRSPDGKAKEVVLLKASRY